MSFIASTRHTRMSNPFAAIDMVESLKKRIAAQERRQEEQTQEFIKRGKKYMADTAAKQLAFDIVSKRRSSIRGSSGRPGWLGM